MSETDHPAKAKLADAAEMRRGVQLTIPLEEPKQPECKIGDQVRTIKLVTRRIFYGGPLEQSATVIDGELVDILKAHTEPPGHMIQKQWFTKNSRKSKYDRWIIYAKKTPAFRYQRHVVVTMDKQTRGFLYDLAE